MKFSDIKTLPFGMYACDVSWNMLDDWLKSHEDFNINMDPFFQRGYVWSKEQKTAYVEYILRGGMSGKDVFWNHPYWMHFGNTIGELVLVDGKQRIDAVLGFLHDEVTAFGHKFSEYEGNMRMELATFRMHVNNIEDMKEIVEWYVGLNTGGAIHTKDDLKPALEFLKTGKK